MDTIEFFKGIHLPAFYASLREGHGLSRAIRAAVRTAAGWTVEVEETEQTILARFMDPDGEVTEFELPAGEIPRAWGWWDPPQSRKSFILLWDGDFYEGPELGPDEVFCDVCGSRIYVRPVPVLVNYALCPECFGWVVGIEIQEAADWDGVQLTYGTGEPDEDEVDDFND